METVAMYWEPQIKTYGFQVVKNLAFYRYAISADLSAQWDRAAVRAAQGPSRFHLLAAQQGEGTDLDLLLLCDSGQGRAPADPLAADMPATADRRKQVVAPVELLFFQGPHYGDRFGVADFTYRALAEQADHLLAAVFSCASVYLILPEGKADEACSRLTAAFRIPR